LPLCISPAPDGGVCPLQICLRRFSVPVPIHCYIVTFNSTWEAAAAWRGGSVVRSGKFSAARLNCYDKINFFGYGLVAKTILFVEVHYLLVNL
jgi:hypothetical protein